MGLVVTAVLDLCTSAGTWAAPAPGYLCAYQLNCASPVLNWICTYYSFCFIAFIHGRDSAWGAVSGSVQDIICFCLFIFRLTEPRRKDSLRLFSFFAFSFLEVVLHHNGSIS